MRCVLSVHCCPAAAGAQHDGTLSANSASALCAVMMILITSSCLRGSLHAGSGGSLFPHPTTSTTSAAMAASQHAGARAQILRRRLWWRLWLWRRGRGGADAQGPRREGGPGGLPARPLCGHHHPGAPRPDMPFTLVSAAAMLMQRETESGKRALRGSSLVGGRTALSASGLSLRGCQSL